MNLTFEEIQQVLADAELPADKQRAVLSHFKTLEMEKKAEGKEDKEGGNKNKYRFVALVRGDSELKAKLEGGAFLAAVVDTDDGKLLKNYIRTASARQNDDKSKKSNRGRKGKACEIVNWRDAFAWLKPAKLKEASNGVAKIKATIPIEVQVIESEEIPFDKETM